jgi:hypothetical protein
MVIRGRVVGVVAVAAVVAAGGIAAGCNSVFGINEAQLFTEGGAKPDSEANEVYGDGGVDDAALAFDGNPYQLSCVTYCAVIQQTCTQVGTTSNQEYLSPEVCNDICPLFESTATPNGAVDPNSPFPTTDTLNCRIWHVNAARGGPSEAHVHCPHAGPLGGTICGSDPCIDFCTMDLAFCTGDAAAYTSMNDCLNACRPDAGPDGGYPGFPYNVNHMDPEVVDLAATGNTLNCRMYHLENYLNTDNDVHCSHTSQSGGGVCVN